MPKRIYGVGEPCDVCRTPCIPGKQGGAYCKPCYIKYAESKKSGTSNGTWTPPSAQNTPIPQNTASQREIEELRVQIGELNVTIAKMRTAFQNHDDRIKALETFALGANKTAFDLHSGSHAGIPVIGEKSGDMPKIEFPEGFLKP